MNIVLPLSHEGTMGRWWVTKLKANVLSSPPTTKNRTDVLVLVWFNYTCMNYRLYELVRTSIKLLVTTNHQAGSSKQSFEMLSNADLHPLLHVGEEYCTFFWCCLLLLSVLSSWFAKTSSRDDIGVPLSGSASTMPLWRVPGPPVPSWAAIWPSWLSSHHPS